MNDPTILMRLREHIEVLGDAPSIRSSAAWRAALLETLVEAHNSITRHTRPDRARRKQEIRSAVASSTPKRNLDLGETKS